MFKSILPIKSCRFVCKLWNCISTPKIAAIKPVLSRRISKKLQNRNLLIIWLAKRYIWQKSHKGRMAGFPSFLQVFLLLFYIFVRKKEIASSTCIELCVVSPQNGTYTMCCDFIITLLCICTLLKQTANQQKMPQNSQKLCNNNFCVIFQKVIISHCSIRTN